MNVKRIILACCICVVTTGCSYTSVDAGEEAVLIYKPYFFGHGGVDPTPVKTGATWTAWKIGRAHV